MEPKYANVEVQLTGIDSNAFSIIGACVKALRKANVSSDEINKFRNEAVSGDYDNVLQNDMKWMVVN